MMAITPKTMNETDIVVTTEWTPVFNGKDISQIFDRNGTSGHFKNVETVLFPNTRIILIEDSEVLFSVTLEGSTIDFHVISKDTVKKSSEIGKITMIQITTDDYPSSTAIYISKGNYKCVDKPPELRTCPSIDEILEKARSLVGLKYYWGGNGGSGEVLLASGIPGLPKIDGVDCSGLLYWASNGTLPRNTHDLTEWGDGFIIDELMPPEIVQRVAKPGDLIVFRGHVVIVESENRLIEGEGSKSNKVKFSNFVERLTELKEIAKKYKKTIRLRRWHPEQLEKHPLKTIF